MRTNFLLLLFLITGVHNIIGQSKTNDKNNYISLNLVSPTFSYSPRWTLGYHYVLNERYILGTELGMGSYGTSVNFAADGDWIDNKYFSIEFSPELKYIFNSKSKTKKFIAAELFYIYHRDNLKNEVYRNMSDLKFYKYDSADYQRNKFGLNLNYGLIINFSKNFGLTPKVGLGIKMRDVKFSNIANPIIENNYEESDTFFTSSNDYLTIEGFETNINFNFELQLFFKFN